MIHASPTLSAVLAHAGDHTHAALTTALIADGETVLGTFRKLAGDDDGAFLLESVEGGELMGRYSFLGAGVRDALMVRDGVAELRRGGEVRRFPAADPLEPLRALLGDYRVWSAPDLPRFLGGAVGYVSFDAMAAFEQVPLPPGEGAGVPDAHFFLTDEVVVYDHLAHRLICVTHVPLGGDRAGAYAAGVDRLRAMVERLRGPTPTLGTWSLDVPAPVDALRVSANRSRADYEAAVLRAKSAIEAGEVFQVVVSQRLSVEARISPFELYRSLRALNPSPYMFYLRFAEASVVGASPEVLVRLEGDQILVRPIAGTRRRGQNPEEDLALERDLLADAKELAEHRMLLDLGRNDVGRVAAVGSVRVEDPLHIERYAHVMHIVSDVRGDLAPGKDAFEVLRAGFPAGTVSGAPKIRACELLAELEPDRRGLYAGAVGYFDYAGNMDTCIAIRTMVVEPDRVHLQAGAGIVYDSVPALEYEECLNKARSGLKAVALTLARQQDVPE